MRLGFFIYYPIIYYLIIAYPFPEYPMQKLHSAWGACVWAGPPPRGHVTGRAHPNRGTRPNYVFVLFIKTQPPF